MLAGIYLICLLKTLKNPGAYKTFLQAWDNRMQSFNKSHSWEKASCGTFFFTWCTCLLLLFVKQLCISAPWLPVTWKWLFLDWKHLLVMSLLPYRPFSTLMWPSIIVQPWHFILQYTCTINEVSGGTAFSVFNYWYYLYYGCWVIKLKTLTVIVQYLQTYLKEALIACLLIFMLQYTD